MAKTHEVESPEAMPSLPPNYDPARAERIRELWKAMHASDDPAEKERIWDELGDYILGPSR
jgi:hypothetical protein